MSTLAEIFREIYYDPIDKLIGYNWIDLEGNDFKFESEMERDNYIKLYYHNKKFNKKLEDIINE